MGGHLGGASRKGEEEGCIWGASSENRKLLVSLIQNLRLKNIFTPKLNNL